MLPPVDLTGDSKDPQSIAVGAMYLEIGERSSRNAL
jgi:hypothetical protein